MRAAVVTELVRNKELYMNFHDGKYAELVSDVKKDRTWYDLYLYIYYNLYINFILILILYVHIGWIMLH